MIKDCAQNRPTEPEVVWRVKGSHRLGSSALAVLREIWHRRETEAVGANKPPYFVLTPESMVDLTEAAVKARPLKETLPHISPRRYKGILSPSKKVWASTSLPASSVPPYRQSEAERKRMQDLERRRNHRATDLGIDPTLLTSPAMLVLLAKDWEKTRTNS